ncbi:uncharacterized protein [Bemisia tabaci]|uniref:uncharacterized protein isoform X5 n=1 Tax=Bemisia tabaci TaxID=7038 RepID=UPI003B288A87
MKNPIIVIIKLYHLSNYLVDGKRGFRQKFKPEDDVEPLCPLFPHEWPPEEIERRLKGDDIIPDVIPCSPKYVINRMTKFLGVIILILWFVNVGVLHSFITILWYLATQVTYIPGVTVYFGNKLEPEELKKEPVKCGWPVTPGHNYTLMLTGLHRYVFIVYEQPKVRPKWHEPPIHDFNDGHRVKFSNQKFSRKYNLGDLYAANYFHSEPDPLEDDDFGPSIYEKRANSRRRRRE